MEYEVKDGVFSVYDYEELTLQELLSIFNEVITQCQNKVITMEELVDYMVGQGLSEEVAKQIAFLIDDGTMGDLVGNVVADVDTKVNQLRDEMNNKIDNVNNTISEIGGANLLLGTSKEYKNIEVGAYASQLGNQTLADLNLKPGDYVTLRCYIKASYKKLSSRITLQDTTGVNQAISFKSDDKIDIGTEGYSTVTVQIPPGFTNIITYIQNENATNQDNVIEQYREAKLEKGQIPTSWTHNPSEIDSKIKNVEDKATTNANNITSLTGSVTGHSTTLANHTTYINNISNDLVKHKENYYFNGKLNFKEYIESNKIDVTSGYGEALQMALAYCINSKRTLFIPKGTYKIEKQISITKIGNADLIIEGEGMGNTILECEKTGFYFASGQTTIAYETRITHIQVKNMHLKFVGSDTNNEFSGLVFRYWGYVKTENLKISGFKNSGLSLLNGSEYDDYNSQIYSCGKGIYIGSSDLSNSDFANANFNGTRVYSNTNNLYIINAREVNFNGCAIMDYNGASELRGNGGIVNFTSCDFENKEGIVGLKFMGKYTVNINNCIFANPYPNKLYFVGGSNCTVKVTGTLIDNTISKVVRFDPGVNSTIEFDRDYNNYYIDGDNFNQPFKINYPLCNLTNTFFEKGVDYPLGKSVTTTLVSHTYKTGGWSVGIGSNSNGVISYPCDLMGIRPKVVELIVKGASSNNLLNIVKLDGTSGLNYTLGGSDMLIQYSSDDYRRILYILPSYTDTNPITHLQIVTKTTDTPMYVDSIKIYGEGVTNKLYASEKPTQGRWKKGDVVYNKSPGLGLYEKWVCVSGDGTDVGTWRSIGKIEE